MLNILLTCTSIMCSTNLISIQHNLMQPPTPTPNPHPRTQERIPLVPSLQIDINPKLILIRRRRITLIRIHMYLLHHIPWPRPPPFGPHHNHRRRIVIRLYQETRIRTRREILVRDLTILTTGDYDTLAPTARPLPADEGDPVALAATCCWAYANGHARIKFYAHAEVEVEGRGGKGEGAGDVAFVEAVQEVVGGYGVFHYV